MFDPKSRYAKFATLYTARDARGRDMSTSSACVVLLPVRLFGGHEKMLLEWLGEACRRHGLRVHIYSADNPRLVADGLNTISAPFRPRHRAPSGKCRLTL